ncbi:hypothetical protein [Algibacter pectinivorans]|uniref:Lipopolysaccharide core biosynthesis protein rfaS n=1 Tax=Algibacter pectinivorans TaxID=870482 RepID=A0A1I1RDW0_9FLAO|nr:hypothetical protein [Algibacter pectinivorans]SFD32432.1 hypothetical protein SAMN04487987_109141 [Algibacter pectinivorans]
MKRITLIGPNSFGYLDFLITALQAKQDVEVTYINYSVFKYSYSSKLENLKNVFIKAFLNKNIKDSYKSKCILDCLSGKAKQDFIVLIRPDKIEKKTLLKLKNYTENLFAFYFDAIAKFPKKKELIPIFDKVYSYEKDDVETYGLEFITNYIYDFDDKKPEIFSYKVFNISSYDSRFKTLKNIAEFLKKNHIKYNIIVRKEIVFNDDLVTVVPEYLPLNEVKKHILNSEILLDIQKGNQKGLSFRVFEALGYNKKLITTNKDIINYNFYNSNNILVINSENIDIPSSFFNIPYTEIDKDILFPYTLEGWIQKVFSV